MWSSTANRACSRSFCLSVSRVGAGVQGPPRAVEGVVLAGRLILWSNDLLRELVGNGFENQQHAADFLWWAKDQSGGLA